LWYPQNNFAPAQYNYAASQPATLNIGEYLQRLGWTHQPAIYSMQNAIARTPIQRVLPLPLHDALPRVLRYPLHLAMDSPRRSPRALRVLPSIYSTAEQVANDKISESVYGSIKNLLADTEVTTFDELVNDIRASPAIATASFLSLCSHLSNNQKFRNVGDSYIETNSFHLEDGEPRNVDCFRNFFTLLWQRIVRNENRDEMVKILNQELEASLDNCFYGLLCRLISVLSGFYPDIVINISSAEQISNIIKNIGMRLRPYNIAKHKELVMKQLIEYDYKQKTIDEWIPAIDFWSPLDT